MTVSENLAADRKALTRIYLRFARRGQVILAVQRQKNRTTDVSEAGRPGTSVASDIRATERDAKGR